MVSGLFAVQSNIAILRNMSFFFFFKKKKMITGVYLVVFQVWFGDGRVVQWCWVNFQCRGVLLTWIRVGQGPTALAVGAGGGVWTFFSRLSFLFFSPSLWETARYRLKYCLKRPLSPKTTHQPNPSLVLTLSLPKSRGQIFRLQVLKKM